MTILTVPLEDLEKFNGEGYVKNRMAYLAIYIVILATSCFIGTFLAQKSGSFLGENVTYSIRKELYSKIL